MFSATIVLPELKLNLPLLEFWEQCKEKDALFVNADSFLLQLDVKFGARLRTNHPEIADDGKHCKVYNSIWVIKHEVIEGLFYNQGTQSVSLEVKNKVLCFSLIYMFLCWRHVKW